MGRPLRAPTLCAYAIDAEPIFDTLDEERCRALGVSDSDLARPAWEAAMLVGAVPASQALADRLIAAGHAGMRVRSFTARTGPGDLNLAMWTWGPDRPARVVPIDDARSMTPDR